MKRTLLTLTIASLLATTAFADPIHVAAAGGDLAAIRAELDKDVDVNAKDNEGRTPLHYAAKYATKQVVELLIPNGADVNAKDEDGWTPLHFAAAKEIVELLIHEGADVNAKNKWGGTPLHAAATNGKKETVELLIAADADVNAKAKDGKTPLDMANGAIADLLRKHGGKTGEELLMPRLSDIRTYWERVQLAELVINGKVGLKCGVRYSTDLKEWHVLDTVTLEASPQVYVDKSAEQCPHWCLQPMRFYRVKLVE